MAYQAHAYELYPDLFPTVANEDDDGQDDDNDD